MEDDHKEIKVQETLPFSLEDETAALSLDESTAPTILRVGKTIFSLDASDLANLNSEFINNILSNAVSRPENGMHEIPQANAECFSTLLHFSRFHTLLIPSCGEKKLLEQTDFWLIQPNDKIRIALLNTRDKLKLALLKGKFEFNQAVKKQIEKNELKIHHNYRKTDGAGRIYCLACGHRDMDSRFYFPGDWRFLRDLQDPRLRKGSDYIKCKGCQKMVTCKPDLGWCHKCNKCKYCQGIECPHDSDWDIGSYRCSRRTTHQPHPFNVFCEDANILKNIQQAFAQ